MPPVSTASYPISHAACFRAGSDAVSQQPDVPGELPGLLHPVTCLTLTACEAQSPAAPTRQHPNPVCTLPPSQRCLCCWPRHAPALQTWPVHLVCGLQIANFTAFISPNPQDSALSLLPPWHIYERAVGYYLYARACRQVRPAGWAERQSSTSAACVTCTCCHCSSWHAQAGEASAALPGAPSVLVPFTGCSTPAQSAAHPLLHACWVMGCKCFRLACPPFLQGFAWLTIGPL